MYLLALVVALCAALSFGDAGARGTTKATRPNIVFLHDESTDGRLYLPDSPAGIPIPNIRSLYGEKYYLYLVC